MNDYGKIISAERFIYILACRRNMKIKAIIDLLIAIFKISEYTKNVLLLDCKSVEGNFIYIYIKNIALKCKNM